MVRLAGIEPTTPWFVAKYSIQLSYSRAALEYTSSPLTSAQAGCGFEALCDAGLVAFLTCEGRQCEPSLAARCIGEDDVFGRLLEQPPRLAPELEFGQRATDGERYCALARIRLRRCFKARQPLGA